eukprot:5756932-Prymnesium_polylepis.1
MVGALPAARHRPPAALRFGRRGARWCAQPGRLLRALPERRRGRSHARHQPKDWRHAPGHARMGGTAACAAERTASANSRRRDQHPW